MATHFISLLGHASKPDTSGNVWQEPYSIAATNDYFDGLIWRFKDTSTDLVLHGRIIVPNNYVTTATIVLMWTATATTGNVIWGFNYRAIADGASLDQATAIETVTSAAQAAPASVNLRKSVSLALTSANLAAGNSLEFRITRNGTSGSDTMAADALLFDAYLSYSDV